jgi:hypothetical protein
MPRFNFHGHDGSDLLDTQGTDLPDFRTVRREAVMLAGRLLLDKPDTSWEGSDWHMTVTDAVGLFLFWLDFTATNAPNLASANTN